MFAVGEHALYNRTCNCHRGEYRAVFGVYAANGYICESMKNIVFDLGQVVFARDLAKCDEQFIRFFSYVAETPMPRFWIDYDMGVSDFDKVIADLSAYRGADEEYTRALVLESIEKQEPIAPTERLIRDLKAAGYKLYVLSNMSREFIDFLRRTEVYSCFDGDVISCEERVVKPMPRIYDILLERFALDPAQTLFIDDRKENVEAAAAKGIGVFHFDKHDREGSCARLRKMLL